VALAHALVLAARPAHKLAAAAQLTAATTTRMLA
jgi:hypothetical protein